MVRAVLSGCKSTLPTMEDADAYSVRVFCRRHAISVQAFYKYRNEMPATFRVGNRVLISREAALAWRRKREQAAEAVPK